MKNSHSGFQNDSFNVPSIVKSECETSLTSLSISYQTIIRQQGCGLEML